MSLIFHLVWARLGANVHPGPGWGLPWVRATISSSWSPSSDFFSCICFALNIMKSKTLQRFSPKILVADLKVCKILLCVSSLPWCYFFFFHYPKVSTWRGHSPFMLQQKVFCVLPRPFPEHFEAVYGLREL